MKPRFTMASSIARSSSVLCVGMELRPMHLTGVEAMADGRELRFHQKRDT